MTLHHRTQGRRVVVLAIVVFALGATSIANAQRRKAPPKPAPPPPPEEVAPPDKDPAPPPTDETPWGKGVSAESKATAQALLEEGNARFLENKYREALDKYQAAIEAWDHPAIRFNIARAQINLEKWMDAQDSLERALAYGSDPLEDSVYSQALDYQKLLHGQIGQLEVSCSQDGAVITVDGDEFLRCPGSKTQRVAPGSHAVVGKKADHLTLTRDLVVLGGTVEKVELQLVSIADATITTRRWSSWKPWAVVGGGAVIGGLGVLLQLKAQSDLDRYGEQIAIDCPDGCPPGNNTGADLESQAYLENKIAVSAMVTGAAVVITGLALVILNRPRAMIPKERPTGPQVTPVVTGDQVGLALFGQF